MSKYSAKISLEFTSNLKAVTKQLDKSTKKISDSIGNVTKKVAKSTSKFKDFAKTISNKVGSAFSGVTSKLSGITSSLGAMLGTGGVLGLVAAGLAAIAAAVTSVITGFVKLTTFTLTFADRVGKLSTALGVSTDFFQRFEQVAELGGLTGKQSENILRSMNLAIGMASRGTGESAKIFKDLGISLKNSKGEIKSQEELMYDVAEAFSKIKDGPIKSEAAMKLFGGRGGKVLNLMKGGAEGLKKALGEVGATLSDRTIKSAELFNDSMTNFKNSFIGLGNSLSPMFEKLTILVDKLTESRSILSGMEVTVRSIVGLVNQLLPQGKEVVGIFGVLNKILGWVASVIEGITAYLQIIATLWKLIFKSISLVGDGLTIVFNILKSKFAPQIEMIKNVFKTMAPIIKHLLDPLLQKIQPVLYGISKISKAVNIDSDTIWGGIGSAFGEGSTTGKLKQQTSEQKARQLREREQRIREAREKASAPTLNTQVNVSTDNSKVVEKMDQLIEAWIYQPSINITNQNRPTGINLLTYGIN